MLEIDDLSWIPPNAETPLWEGVSFSVEPGEILILTGPSGSGKSSLLRCIVGLEERSTGTIRWHGREIDEENIRRFRHRVVYVHQSPVSIASTIDENLSFPRTVGNEFPDYEEKHLDEDDQRELLARFGIKELDFSRRFDELSVGEQQRVALVRCLTVQPEGLLLDEPTASVDEETARLIEDYVTDYVESAGDIGAVWVSHDTEQRERLPGRDIALDQWLVD